MKRVLATLGGLVAGLLLTWGCMVVLSHLDLPHISEASGCSDVEHCDGRWWLGPLILGLFLSPTVGFAAAGYFAVARAWPARKVVVAFALLGAVTVIFLTAAYMK